MRPARSRGGWKYIMDTAPDTHTYNIARKHYLEKYHKGRYKEAWAETEYRRIFLHVRGKKKKRKWVESRKVGDLSQPIPNGTHVAIRNPWPYMLWQFPTTLGDFSHDEIIGVVKGFLPPREDYYRMHNVYGSPPVAPRIPGRYFTRERRYRVVPLVGSSKGRILHYDASWMRVITPEELPSVLFVQTIRDLSGEL